MERLALALDGVRDIDIDCVNNVLDNGNETVGAEKELVEGLRGVVEPTVERWDERESPFLISHRKCGHVLDAN